MGIVAEIGNPTARTQKIRTWNSRSPCSRIVSPSPGPPTFSTLFHLSLSVTQSSMYDAKSASAMGLHLRGVGSIFIAIKGKSIFTTQLTVRKAFLTCRCYRRRT
jgi:hypothetical protein